MKPPIKPRKAKQLIAIFLSMMLFLGLLPLDALQSELQALTQAGDVETFQAAGPRYDWYFRFPNGSALKSWTTQIVKESDGKAVFCVEPTHALDANGRYVAYLPEGVTLNGYSNVVDYQMAPNFVMTADQVEKAALFVYHGWDSSTQTADEYMAVQLYLWELLWKLEVVSMTNLANLRSIQQRILNRISTHTALPKFSGTGFDPSTQTITIKTGETLSLVDASSVVNGSQVAANLTGVKVSLAANVVTLQAGQDIRSGKIEFMKYPDVKTEATSLIFAADSSGQRVGEFMLRDPLNFSIQVEALTNGQIIFRKQDSTGGPLDGALFELRDSAGQLVTLQAISAGAYRFDASGPATSFTTAGGQALLSELPVGEYRIIELKAPSGYEQDTELSVSAVVGPSESTSVSLTNQAQTGELLIRKLDAETQSGLTGAKFSVIGPNGFAREVTSGADGSVRLTGLTLGTYKVTEIVPPQGYLLATPASQEVTLVGSDSGNIVTGELSFKNLRQTASLSLVKKGPGGQGLAGAEFLVTGANAFSRKVVTGADGKAVLADIPLGSYEVKEISPPTGYFLDPNSTKEIRFSGDSSGLALTGQLIFENLPQTAELTIRKLGGTGELLPGAEFLVTGPEGFTRSVTTGSDGSVILGDLNLGTYKVTETSPPTGYLLDISSAKEITLLGDGSGKKITGSLTFTNVHQTAAIEIVKQGPTGAFLAGAEFLIGGPDGFSRSVQTGADGSVTLSGLALGTYIITETKAPQGHLLSAERSQTVTFTADKSAANLVSTLVFANDSQQGEFHLLKLDETDRTPLAGVRFEIRDSSGVVVKTVETDAQGTARSGLLPLGSYRIYETLPALGYRLPDDTLAGEITLSGDQSGSHLFLSFGTLTNARQVFSATVHKTDQATGNPLAGAVFELKDPTGMVLETLTSDGSGKTTSHEHPLLHPNGLYTIVEVEAPAGYLMSDLPRQEFAVVPDRSSQVLKFDFAYENRAITAPVEVQKYDVINGLKPSGSALFTESEYEIVVVDLFDPDNAPYRAGEVAETLVVDAQGKARSLPLHLGTYDLVEKKAGAGYQVNQTAIRFQLQQQDNTAKIIQLSRNSAVLIAEMNERISELNKLWQTEGAARPPEGELAQAAVSPAADIVTAERSNYGRVEINKVLDQSLAPIGEPKLPEEGIEFSLTNSKGELMDTLVTNQNGWASSKWLPFDEYVLEQKTVQANAYPIKPLTIRIEEDWHLYLYQLQNEEVSARLRIVKTDKESKRQIPQAGVTFEIYQEDGSKLVQKLYYPQEQSLDRFVTNDEGSVMLPEVLAAGNYVLREVKGPQGYVLPEEGIEIHFSVNRDQVSRLQDLMLLLEVENQAAYGQIRVDKQGPILKDWEKKSFTYRAMLPISESSLSDVSEPKETATSTPSTEVTASQNPSTEASAEVVSEDSSVPSQASSPTQTTEPTPSAQAVDSTETSTADSGRGSLASGEIRLSRQQNAQEFAWTEQSLDVFEPVFAQGFIAGAIFEIRAKDAIYFADGTQAYAEGEVVERLTTNSVSAIESELLPLGTYELEEIEAPAGYVRDQTVYDITLSQENPSQALVQENIHVENVRQKASVYFNKEFEQSAWFGAYKLLHESVVFGLFTAEDLLIGDVLLKAGSCVGTTYLDENAAGQFDNVLPGISYLLRELATAQEYQLNEEGIIIAFEEDPMLPEHSEIIVAESIQNRLKKQQITLVKVDSQNSEQGLSGASFKLVALTSDGEKELGVFVSDADGTLRIEGLDAGTYYLEEILPPQGYHLESDRIEVVVDGSREHLEVAASNQKTRVQILKLDGESRVARPGAVMQIFDKQNTLIAEWTSDETPKVLEGLLLAGETYTLHEKTAPPGYAAAEDLVFTIELSDETQKLIELENFQTTLSISKETLGGSELPGAKLSLFDADGGLLESWLSGEEAHVIKGLELGKSYTLFEDTAPLGYELAQSFSFILNEDGSPTHIVMINELTPEPEVPLCPELPTPEIPEPETPEPVEPLPQQPLPEPEVPKTGEGTRTQTLLLSVAAGLVLTVFLRARRKIKDRKTSME